MSIVNYFISNWLTRCPNSGIIIPFGNIMRILFHPFSQWQCSLLLPVFRPLDYRFLFWIFNFEEFSPPPPVHETIFVAMWLCLIEICFFLAWICTVPRSSLIVRLNRRCWKLKLKKSPEYWGFFFYLRRPTIKLRARGSKPPFWKRQLAPV